MRRPSPALVVATVALFFSLAGTGYAVSQLPRNSVGSAQLTKNAVTAVKIKNNAVTAAKIRTNAVTGAKVRDGSLTSSDFAAGTLLKGATGPAGPKGDAGSIASTSASSVTAVTVGSTPVVVIDTAPSRNIVVSVRSRLIITGFAVIDGDAAAWAGNLNVACYPQGEDSSGQVITLNDRGDSYANLDLSRDASVPIPVVNTADVEAGTYRVWVECYRSGSTPPGTMEFTQGNLAVVAAPL